MADLIDLYFGHVNIFIPVLHRPTLEKSIADGFHHHVPGFGEIILLVCAIGARYSNDSRVFLENIGSEFSAGWKWFIQIHTARRPRLTPPCLYDLQVQYVGVLFILLFRILKIGLAVHRIFARFLRSPKLLGYGWRRNSPCARSGRSQAKDTYFCINSRGRIVETCILVQCDITVFLVF